MAHTDHHGPQRQSHPSAMTTCAYDSYLTATHGWRWPSASNRSDLTDRTRFAGARVGDAAATTPHASCVTNRSATRPTTSRHWLSRHIKFTQVPRCTYGDMTTTYRDGAYRQLPLDNLENAYVFLHTPEGPTLWFICQCVGIQPLRRRYGLRVESSPAAPHHALCGRLRPRSPSTPTPVSTPSRVNGALGYKMKPSTRQPPAPSHKIGDR